jgi:probable HAF family extracellular repeat protein
MCDLGTLNTGARTAFLNTSIAFAINNASDVVGQADTGGRGETHAILYRNGTMYDLNWLIAAGSGWELMCARSINNRGQIVGYGIHQGLKHAFLLIPAQAQR